MLSSVRSSVALIGSSAVDRRPSSLDRLCLLLLLLPAMTRHAALAPGLARLFARPLVRRTLLMRSLAALARNLALLARSIDANPRSSFATFSLPTQMRSARAPVRSSSLANARAATDVPRDSPVNHEQSKNLGKVFRR